MSEGAQQETVTQLATFSEYEPVFLDTETLGKILTLLYDIEPEKIPPQDLAKRLAEDKFVVRQKYNLPDDELCDKNPGEYYDRLEKIANQEKVSVREKREFAQFFKTRMANAVYLGSHQNDRGGTTIAMEKLADQDSRGQAWDKAKTLEHELIHALQHKRYPQMNLIRREYEAYIANGNEKTFETNPFLFVERITLSVMPTQLEEMWNDYQENKNI